MALKISTMVWTISTYIIAFCITEKGILDPNDLFPKYKQSKLWLLNKKNVNSIIQRIEEKKSGVSLTWAWSGLIQKIEFGMANLIKDDTRDSI